jgi:hypothetical protein
MELQTLHPDVLKQIDSQRHADALRQSAQRRLVKAAAPQPWIAQQGCWVLCQIGHALVWLGRRLERSMAPQAA